MTNARVVWVSALVTAGVLAASAQAPRVRYERVFPLKSEEGVFAYARISPDGQTLAYTSIMPDPERLAAAGLPRQPSRTTQTVVDLKTGNVQFTEAGIDAVLVARRRADDLPGAVGRRRRRNHAPSPGRRARPQRRASSLGDYFSWAMRDGRNLILTIQSNYYYLDGDKAVLPAGRVVPCDGIGVGDRPLISKDGRRITTFVRGSVVVRGLTDCENTIDTGLQGAKADFSFDGRYIAFHVARAGTKTYEIVIVDLERKTVRTLPDLPGSSLFPSWTKDGRLCFRYDSDDYRGFMMASNVLSLPERPLSAAGTRVRRPCVGTICFPRRRHRRTRPRSS